MSDNAAMLSKESKEETAPKIGALQSIENFQRKQTESSHVGSHLDSGSVKSQAQKQMDLSSAMSQGSVPSGHTARDTKGHGQQGQQLKQRKYRRMANEIQKDFKCLYCDKKFGSEAATVLHMRNKHSEGTK